MKKLFWLIALFVGLVSCQNNAPEIKMSESLLSLKVGDVHTLDVIGAKGDVTWTCLDDTVASVYYGVVTAKAIGQTTIIASCGKSSVECIVQVTGTDGSTMRITPYVAEMQKAETRQFTAANSYGLEMSWESSNPEVATVSADGVVTAHKGGNAWITAKTSIGEARALVAVKHTWGEYKMVWSEEFDGNELDRSVWNVEVNGSGGGNKEAQFYTDRPENLRVKDGNLEIELRKEDYNLDTKTGEYTHHYTSGRINSKNKKDFLYGKMEARILLPSGGGTWPAFWMLGYGSWPACGEIDIMEYVGNVKDRILGTLHTTKDRSGSISSRACKVENVENNYHVYGCEWVQEESLGKDVIRFYVDDVVYSEQIEREVDNREVWPFDRPEFFILNMAVGGSLGGHIDDSMFANPVVMKVDWIHVYQREEIE